jgi:hypothetical protein
MSLLIILSSIMQWSPKDWHRRKTIPQIQPAHHYLILPKPTRKMERSDFGNPHQKQMPLPAQMAGIATALIQPFVFFPRHPILTVKIYQPETLQFMLQIRTTSMGMVMGLDVKLPRGLAEVLVVGIVAEALRVAVEIQVAETVIHPIPLFAFHPHRRISIAVKSLIEISRLLEVTHIDLMVIMMVWDVRIKKKRGR